MAIPDECMHGHPLYSGHLTWSWLYITIQNNSYIATWDKTPENGHLSIVDKFHSPMVAAIERLQKGTHWQPTYLKFRWNIFILSIQIASSKKFPINTACSHWGLNTLKCITERRKCALTVDNIAHNLYYTVISDARGGGSPCLLILKYSAQLPWGILQPRFLPQASSCATS